MEGLNGEAEILRYLGIRSGTALRRWRAHGLPVYTTPTGRLFAVCEELKAWRRLPEFRTGGDEVDAWSDFLKRVTSIRPARQTGRGA